MNLKEYLPDDRAVSPVIGVILMVAITVILAAVIGTFVLGLGQDMGNNAPQAQFQFTENNDGTVTVEHVGGDTIDAANLNIRVADSDAAAENQFSGDVSGGASTTVSASAGETVRLVWSDPSSDQTQVLTDHTVAGSASTATSTTTSTA